MENKTQENIEASIVYELSGKTYINLTNKCTNKCKFCIRNVKDNVMGSNMWFKEDNIKAQDVIKAIKENEKIIHEEIVYCGYGEPTLRIDALIESAKYLKNNFKNINIRLNTNGHANLVYKRNIVPEIKNYIDSVSISLNGENEQIYNDISQPKIKNAYKGMIEFAKQCVINGIETTLTVVTQYGSYDIDKDKCRNIAEKIGAKYRERPYLDSGY